MTLVELPAFWQKIIVLLVIVTLVWVLVANKLKPSLAFFAASMVLVLSGVIHVQDFLTGISNTQIITIFLLIVITARLKGHFNLIGRLDKVFSTTKSPKAFMIKMFAGVSLVSSVVNNTPIVALFIPYVYEQSKRFRVPASKLLMPLSFAAIVGGMMTTIGTSTNLVLNGFIEQEGDRPLSVTDFLYLGILVTVAGLLYFYFFAYQWLPGRRDALSDFRENTREYLVETVVESGSRYQNKTVTEGGLRNLEGLFLVEIIRGQHRIAPVGPDEVLLAKDILIFAGKTETILDLTNGSNGLSLRGQKKFDMTGNLDVVEAVIPGNSNLVGARIRETDFRERYDAAIVAIHRDNERLTGKIGEQALEPGDLLLLVASKAFYKRVEQHKNIYVISKIQDMDPPKSDYIRWFTWLFVAIIGAVIIGFIPLIIGLIVITGLLMVFKLTTLDQIKNEIDLHLLIILISALALGKGIINSGAADFVTSGLISYSRAMNPLLNAAILMGFTIVLTSFITNVAAVSIVFPFAYTLARDLGIDPTPFYVAIAFGASAAFMTPFGYQTNLMVYGPGGYTFRDFVKIGTPFTIVYFVICILFLKLYYGL